jgi:predicted ATPase with chaperone activity
MENKEVTISRAQGTLAFPANFTSVAAIRPCPCGVQARREDWSRYSTWGD